jgi:y4mF family transcriptional regulator
MIIRTAKDIGLLIKEARSKAGLSQAALAEKINTTQTWISWVENGKSTAEIGLVLQTLTVLGITMDFRLPVGQAGTTSDPAPYRL